jgi:WD40 repeat protein
MPFKETKLPLDDTRSDKTDMTKKSGISDYTRHLYGRADQAREETDSVSSSAQDRGKRQLSAWEVVEEKWRKDMPLAENGERAERIVNLINDKLRGGMWRGDGASSSRGSDRRTDSWLCDPERLIRTHTLTGHEHDVRSLALSADGQTLVSGSKDKTIKIWDMRTKQLRHTLTEHIDWVTSLALSADGQTLVSGSSDKTIKIWDMRTRQLRHTLTGHTGSAWSLALSADGQTLVSGSGDKTIKIWDMRTGQLRRTLTGHGDYVDSLALSADGQTLVSGSCDNTIRIWKER